MHRRIAKRLQSSLPLWGVPLILVFVMSLLGLWGDSARELMMLDRAAIAEGQVWRLLSAHFVHLNAYHLNLNLVAVGVYVLLCGSALSPRDWLLRLFVLGLGVGLGLYLLVPEIGRYAGFSGVAHGLFMLGLWPMVRRGDRIALLCMLVLMGKIAWEQWFGAPVSDAEAIGGRVAIEAHALGVAVALAYGAAFEWRSGGPGAR
jgi:rhomboid family GlyGly-CTERM serine protease